MISNKMRHMLGKNSAIRAMFEEGKRLKKEFGEDKVFDFSLGNPNAKVPKEIKDAIVEILDKEDSLLVHGYMSNAGYEDVREAIARSLNRRFLKDYTYNNLIMTTGAAMAINICLKTLLNSGDEVISFSPYFVEYGNYVGNYDGKLVIASTYEDTFYPNMEEFYNSITKKTKAIIINSPNNPTGVVYSKEILMQINTVLRKKEKELGISIITISDEPYRELVYDNTEVPWVPDFIDKTVVVYSYSKSLSLPGERIGWILIPNEIEEFEDFVAALTIANRCSGSVNAPSLMQRVIGRCVDVKIDIEYYDRNRILLLEIMREAGIEVLAPKGAFYIFLKSPIADDVRFCEICKKYNILLVPGSAFGKSGYARLSYCVSYNMIEASKRAFIELGKEFID